MAAIRAALVLCLLASGCDAISRDSQYRTWRETVEAVTADRVTAVDHMVMDHLATARSIAAYPTLEAIARRSDAGQRADLEVNRHAAILFGSAAEIHQYRRAWLLTADARVLMAAPPSDTLPTATRAALTPALAAGAPVPRLYAENGKIAILFAAPIRDSGSQRPIGWVVTEVDAARYLVPLLRLHSFDARIDLVIGQPLDTALFLLDGTVGSNLSALAGGRESGPAATASIALRVDTSGLFERKEQSRVIAAARQLGAAPWVISAQVETSAIELALWRERRWALTALLASTVGAAAIVAGLSYGIRARHRGRLALAEARVTQLTTHTNDAIFWIGPDLRILEANRRALELYGYTRDELLAGTIAILHRSADRDQVRDRIRAMTQSQGGMVEAIHRRRDSTTFPVEMTTWRVEAEGQSVLCLVVRDVSDRVAARDQLAQLTAERQRTAEQLRLLSEAVDQSPVSVMITDRQGTIAYVNKAFTLITGYRSEEAIGRKPNLLKSGEQDDEFYSILWTTITSGRIWKGEMHNRRKDDTLWWQSAVIAPVLDGAGSITHFIGVSEDITARKDLEQRFLHAQRMEAVGQLAGGVAHDFNNLLTVIMGRAEMLRDDRELDADGQEDLDQVLRAAGRAADLTQQLLVFSKKQVQQLRIVALAPAVAAVDKMIRRLIGADIRLTTKLAPDTGSVRVDPGQLEQVILNLVVNARDAMPHGGELSLETSSLTLGDDRAGTDPSRSVPAGDYACLKVRDTGTGMDEPTRSRIFEPFFTTKKDLGTGLGLATVYEIVTQSGGTVWCESSPGHGACFTILLPRAAAKPDQPTAPSPTQREGADDETILVVEDEPSVRQLIAGTLTRHGFTVLAAGSGERGLELAQAHPGPIHLIISDVVLPGQPGPAFVDAVRSARPEARILFMSGYSDDAVIAKGVTAGEIDLLPKPFLPGALIAKVRQLLDATSGKR